MIRLPEDTVAVSDLHYGHDKPFIWGPETDRGFQSADEHDKFLEEEALRVQGKNLLFLGDFCLTCPWKKFENFLKLFTGDIYMVWGNHNGNIKEFWNKRRDPNRRSPGPNYSARLFHGNYLHNLGNYAEVKWRGYNIVCFHYPILEWNKMHRGWWHLSGHVHNKYEVNSPFNESQKGLDIAVDNAILWGLQKRGRKEAFFDMVDIEKIMDKKQIRPHY